MDGDEKRLGSVEAVKEGLLEVSCGHVVCVFCHCRDGEGEVALDEDCCSPPGCPGVVSFGISSEFWGAYGVEFRDGRVSWVLKNECIGLGLEAEGVVVDFRWEEGNGVGLLSYSPECSWLDGVNDLEQCLGGRGEVGCHCSRFVWLSVFCCCEKLVKGM